MITCLQSWMCREILLRRQHRHGATREVPRVASHDTIGTAGIRSRCLHGIFEVGYRKLKSTHRFTLSGVCHRNRAQQLTQGEMCRSLANLPAVNVKGCGKTMPCDENRLLQLIASHKHLLAIDMMWCPLLQNVEEDIGVDKNSHGTSGGSAPKLPCEVAITQRLSRLALFKAHRARVFFNPFSEAHPRPLDKVLPGMFDGLQDHERSISLNLGLKLKHVACLRREIIRDRSGNSDHHLTLIPRATAATLRSR